MKNLSYLLLLFSVFVFIFSSGCDQSPTGNTYYISSTDSLTNPDVVPRVVFTNPSNGAVGPFDNLDPTQYPGNPIITIQFNKLMNLYNYSSNMITLKSGNEEYPLHLIQNSGDYFNNILVLYLEKIYLAAKTYTLTIDTTLRDIHGKKLISPYIINFNPEPKFRVVYVSPANIDVDPNYTSHIYAKFNSKIDTTIFNSISITPNINGTWRLQDYYSSDSTEMTFYFTDQLNFNTQYTVSISSAAKDYNGLPINEPYQFSFSTLPFKVYLDSYSGYTGPNGFYVYNYFGFRFNGNIDTSTVRSSISVSPQISFNLNISNYSNYVQITFDDSQFQRDTKYTIHFDSAILSEKGDNLEPYDYSFTTGK